MSSAESETVMEVSDELLEVRRRRYKEARHDGMTMIEAKMYADSQIDTSQLRHLVALHCPPNLLAKVLL